MKKYYVAFYNKNCMLTWQLIIERDHKPTREELEIIRTHFNRENCYENWYEAFAHQVRCSTFEGWKKCLKYRGQEYNNLYELPQQDCDCEGFCTGQCYSKYT